MIVLDTDRSRPKIKSEASVFLHRLESLRGVAALMVAGNHSFAVLTARGSQGDLIQVLRVGMNGHAAVTLFFVLSGLVLGLSLFRGTGPFAVTYTTFALRRCLRICPAFWVATLVIAGAILWFDATLLYPVGVSDWFAGHWREPLTAQFFLRNFLFLDHRLNVPTWTLRAELVCSMALPLLYLLSVRAGWVRRGLLLLGLVVWSFLGHGNLSAWLFMFYLGFLVPQVGPGLMRGWLTGRWVAAGVAPVAWVLVCATLSILGGSLGNLVEGTAAALFICALLYGPEFWWFRILDWAPTRFYGRISYSFYLYHMVCLYFTAKLALRLCPVSTMVSYAILSGALLLAFSTVVATFLAWLSHRFVEVPGIEFSKRLCRRITATFPARP
jgi:peptidoglycan/LPS O-acetylase OafA/YrhL